MIAVCAAKFVGYVCKKMGRQGVTWAGKVAIKICPDILEQLSSQVRKAIFATCGTKSAIIEPIIPPGRPQPSNREDRV